MKMTRALIKSIVLLFTLTCHFAIPKAFGKNYADTSASVPQISATLQKIIGENRLVGEFKESDMASLPVGILKEINGKSYIIAIDKARFTPQGAFFDIYAQLTLPGTDEALSFAAVNVAFTPGGIAAAAGTRLELVSNHVIKISNKVDLVIPGDRSNYIEWDCNGFKSVNLKGQFEFEKSWLEPLYEKDQKVVASFQINAKDLHNILARVDMTPFAIKGVQDFGFEVKEAVVDMSDIANPDGLMLTSSDLAAWDGEPNLWKGFYLKQLNVFLPPQLANGKGERPVVSATDMTIDNSGISGSFSAANLIKIGDASASGWPLSVDYIEVQLLHNKVAGGSLKGDINVPFLGDSAMRYLAAVETRQDDIYYAFVLETTQEKKFETFLGDIHLYPNSQIKIEKYKGQFIPSAVLHGKVDLNKGILKAPGIAFQDLTVSTQKPYVHKGTLSLDGSVGFKIGSFQCGFDDISIGFSTGQFAIGAKVRIGLMNSEDKGFAATTGVMVLGSVKEVKETVNNGKFTYERTHTKWKFEKVKVNDIALLVKTTAFELDGMIALYEDHPVYGNGFKGKISLKIPALPSKMVAHAIFGSKDDYRYWHVDAFVPIRIPVATGFSIRRLLGGLSYHMERPPVPDPYSIGESDSTGMNNADELLNYVPSREAGLGFLAGVTIATDPTATVFNADVMLEIMFSTDGGLRYVQFDGSGYFFSNLSQKTESEASQAPITAKVYIRYDNTNSSFHASVKTYINVFGYIKGTGPNNLAVEAVMHFEPGQWWMYVGRPSQMMGLSIAGLATVQSYFQAGTRVEDMPPPPPEVTSVLDLGSGNFMEKENAMSTGRGIGFGMHFKVAVGIGKDKGFIYAFLGLGAGTDILLRDYGEARCKGSSGPIGINGWYASGQAYAYLQGRVGVRVKILGRKKEFDILYLSAAALLQAKLPNPAWFRGAVGVKYSILGGLVKGKATMKFEVGTECEIVGGKEIDIKIINDMQPGDLSKDISVFSSPQVAFNLAIGKSFSMMNNEDVVTTYQVKLDEFKLTGKNTGDIKGEIELNDNKDAATLNFRDILPPDADLVASVKLHIEKWTGSTWTPLTEGGKVDYETKSVTFHTGTAPGYIPAENIAYSYPVNQQYNFFTKEYNRGYVKLKRGQPYLFTENDNNGSWKYNVRFEAGDGSVINTAALYDINNTQVNFDIPANLATETVYRLGIVKTPANVVSANDNVTAQSTTVEEDDNVTTITENKLKGVALAATETSLMESAFRTSKYTSFREKMNATSNTMDLMDIATDYVPVIGKRFDSYETFDKFELSGDGNNTAPLLFGRAVPNSNWLQNKIIPLIYQSYPMDNDITIDQRDVKLLGSPPLLAVSVFNNDPATYQLTGEAANAGTAQTVPGRFRIMYFLSYVSYRDYQELLSKAVAKYLSGKTGLVMPPGIGQLMSTTYPEMEINQQYPVELNYRLPGVNTITSTVNYNILYK